jgi:hypothetical protein
MRSSVMKPGDLVQIREKIYSSTTISSLCPQGPGIVISVRKRESDVMDALASGLRAYCEVLMPLNRGGTKVFSFFSGEIERV